MIGNNNDDYDDYLNDDTITIPLSCEDEEQEQEQEQEKKSILQKMIEYKDENTLFGYLYEMSGVFGFTVVLFVGFIFTFPILLVISLIAFFITLKEKREAKNGV
ncbi:hypothetical protein BVE04_004516 [Salmonella enterica subsp. enterica serovar Braenderup]|uniref:hypothetical protein n=1 Tax=Providencia sp. NPDC089923 TaxID=3415004 RepID=UPI0012C8E896|nr:hypothetical protein [Salmonella enterica]ECT3431655.1 hypothetical protein [Salmonella enterica subsp. enterica serovar Braenderup]ECO8408418.1 hypothetical protein [Salmonella enterica]ECU4065227.1 hypothetical protein [Salmonella enterica subsp. enterica serovar Braenderup]EDR5537971.1 hypothetical protein [Salmonella enterica subsp. enterica serovar Braenderup]